MTLNITNTGNVDLENVTLNSSLPTGWTVTYNTENNMIFVHSRRKHHRSYCPCKAFFGSNHRRLCEHIYGILRADPVNADFRVSVKTTTIWGVVAVVIILCTAGGLGYVFRKYGRR